MLELGVTICKIKISAVFTMLDIPYFTKCIPIRKVEKMPCLQVPITYF